MSNFFFIVFILFQWVMKRAEEMLFMHDKLTLDLCSHAGPWSRERGSTV